MTLIGAIGDTDTEVASASSSWTASPASRRSSRSSSPTSSPRGSSTAKPRSSTSAARKIGGEPLQPDRRAVHGRVARPAARRPAGRRQGRPAPTCCAAAPTSRAPRRTRSRGSASRACGCSPRPRSETGLPIVTELMDARDIEPVLEVADVIQVGARNMQNYALLAEIGRSGCPVLLKRGLPARSRSADGRRVHPQGGQREGDALRARHPHVRDRLPLHARPDGRAGAEGR